MGAPHIHGELLRLGFTVAQSTVAKYMVKPGDARSGQSWGTFVRNHLPLIAAMDSLVVPTITFVQLYVLVIIRLARRELVWVKMTAHPTADWIAQQITEAFPWDEAPRYLIPTVTPFTARLSPAACAPWVFVTSRSRPVRRGKTALRND